MNEVYIIIAAVAALGIGLLAGRKMAKANVAKIESEAQKQSQKIIDEANKKAEQLQKERIEQGKEKFSKLKEDFELEAKKRKAVIVNVENKLKNQEAKFKTAELKIKQKEELLSKQQEQIAQQSLDLQKQDDKLRTKLDELETKIDQLDTLKKSQIEALEKVAELKAEDAKAQLIEQIRAEAQSKASSLIKDLVEEAKLSAAKDAKKILITTIQRTATEHAIENCVSVFNIESDDIKGKIIGREGRNIRALEASTGVEIIVDDTPEAIIISGFDPVRREIARLAMHRLVADGRIHPARIEDVVAKTRKDIEQEIVETGEKTVIELGIHGLHPELIKLIGRMRFRSSYGQNLLQHSREVANLCATLAAELGLNAKIAKRAGLLHDIGKVWHEEAEQPHAILGMNLAKKYKESAEVCNAIGAHHDEIEMTSMISPLVQVCDAISGSRPGARREMMESYIKRLEELEKLAVSFKGVSKCYAMQAGRELRVLVDAEAISDKEAGDLSFNISQKIENEMQYPGQIKVTVIRETRAVHYAK